jgi:hypothetical protein
LKKRSKKLLSLALAVDPTRRDDAYGVKLKVFWFFFFKKELLSSFTRLPCWVSLAPFVTPSYVFPVVVNFSWDRL